MTRARRDDGPILVGKRRDTPEIEALLDAFVRDKLRAGRPTRRSLDTYESRPEDLRWVVAAHIVSLGFATGLRPGELSDLKLSDVDLERRRLEVFGKGAKHRSVVLGDDAVVLLTRYLAEIRPKLGDSTYLFVNPTSEAGGNWVGRYRAQSFADHCLVVGRLLSSN